MSAKILGFTIGSNITYIANAHHKKIYVIFSWNELRIDFAKFTTDFEQFGLEIALRDYRFEAKVLVGSKSNHKYKRQQNREFMTVIDNDGRFICENYPIETNRSFIVHKDGIEPQKYGSSNLFEDERGKDWS